MLLITAGAEAKWKVWDLRTYQQLHVYGRKYGHAVSSIDVSMTGMVALGSGAFLDVFKDVFSSAKPMKPYIREMYKGQQIESLRFRPFEEWETLDQRLMEADFKIQHFQRT
eukprot:symbB.v1.2.034135.t1/scaffold4336.1/size40998/1